MGSHYIKTQHCVQAVTLLFTSVLITANFISTLLFDGQVSEFPFSSFCFICAESSLQEAVITLVKHSQVQRPLL